ncbi:MAG: hypothetical protein PHI34_09430 [Acidobacteriota bacterium]|nr:hypothetical protein [Acidobacteriota bacterium]
MKKISVLMLIVGILVCAGIAAAQKPAPAATQKDIRGIMDAGLAAKQAKLDLPFEVFRTQYLPAQQGYQQVFFLKIKNADLGFAPAPASDVVDPSKPPTAPKMRAVVNLFLRIHKSENGVPGKLAREFASPATIEVDQAGFDPEKTEWYTVGFGIKAGEYVAAIGLASQDRSRIGVQYCDFKLPEAKTFDAALDTIPSFFIKEFKQVEGIEKNPVLDKGFFAYGNFQFVPSLDNVFAVGETLNFFSYVFGIKPTAIGPIEIELGLEVVQGDKPAIKFASDAYDSALINLPLALKQTLQIKQGESVRNEIRDLPAGDYTLVMKIKDKGSALSAEKRIDFSIK